MQQTRRSDLGSRSLARSNARQLARGELRLELLVLPLEQIGMAAGSYHSLTLARAGVAVRRGSWRLSLAVCCHRGPVPSGRPRQSSTVARDGDGTVTVRIKTTVDHTRPPGPEVGWVAFNAFVCLFACLTSGARRWVPWGMASSRRSMLLPRTKAAHRSPAAALLHADMLVGQVPPLNQVAPSNRNLGSRALLGALQLILCCCCCRVLHQPASSN